MELYDEKEFKEKNEKNKKMKRMVIIAIIVTCVVITILIIALFAVKKKPSSTDSKSSFTVNGVAAKELENEVLVATSEEDDSTIIYLPIKSLAKYWNYELNRGDSTSVFEDENVCYVNTDKERIIFRADSNIIYKRSLNSDNSVEENIPIQIENPIIKNNGELYIDRYGIQKAFNVIMSNYDPTNKKISITTLDKLAESAQELATELRYSGLDDLFDNQKALLDNMMVVKSENGLKGVVVFTDEEERSSGDEVLGTQYSDIKYISNKRVFIVKSRDNNKVGIMSDRGANKTKVSLRYDSLQLIDNEKNLFLAQDGNRYGVIDINDNIIVNFDFDRIGVDISPYNQKELTNGYIILNKLIPVQRDGKWGFYSINRQADGSIKGELLIGKLLFDGIGCITKTTSITTKNAMIIEGYDLVIVEQNGIYGLMNLDGSVAASPTLNDIYIDTSGGQTKYYMIEKNDKVTEMQEYFQKNNINKKE